MNASTANPSTTLARSVVQALVDAGVTDAVLAPGSRSGALALALHAAEKSGTMRLHVRVDERTAAFLALGLAKASRRVVPVVTTSGTAVANLHPALLEASHANVRVLALTADRPERLRGTGANQTTDQVKLFGTPPFAHLDAATLDPGGVVSDLVTGLRGPAHVNVAFDDPMLPPDDGWRPRPVADVSAVADPEPVPTVLANGPLTVVLAGDDAGRRARVLAEAGAWPLLAEPSSGSRTGGAAVRTSRLLLAGHLAERVERVVVVGHPTLSRPMTRLLARDDVEVVVLGPDLSSFPLPADRVAVRADALTVDAPDDGAWLAAWKQADADLATAIDAILAQEPAMTPLEVAAEVAAAQPPGGLLVVGSSNPIRDLDLMMAPTPVGERRLTLANRGLAGIDGTVSTAIGAALARSSPRALAYLGDLTFLHDVNGLLIGPDEPRPDLTFVVASDDGGSIFATLESGAPAYAAAFERVFATPTGADIGLLCAALGVPHVRVTTVDGLREALAGPAVGLRVVEAMVARSDRRELAAAIDGLAATTP